MSVKLAIIGSKTNSKEIEKLFISLGGCKSGYDTFIEDYYYYIDDYNNITGTIELSNCFKWKVFTYNEFVTKYPYKKEDVVYIRDKKNIPYVIESLKWNNNHVEYVIYKKDNKNMRFTETVENIHFYISNINDIIELNKIDDNKFEVLLDEKYESIVENGKLCIVKKINTYPKTYEECCEHLFNDKSYSEFKFIPAKICDTYYRGDFITHLPFESIIYEVLINDFYNLLVCRDAYWKIAGEEMGLSKPWKPDLENEELYCIQNYNKQIVIGRTNTAFNKILIFPTEEMRDTFYENFKDLIESCKELL